MGQENKWVAIKKNTEASLTAIKMAGLEINAEKTSTVYIQLSSTECMVKAKP
jgi:hypothetical protein